MSNPLNRKTGWMGDENDELVGFPWRSGKVSTTAGIVIWSDVFLYEEGDEKIAIVLMVSKKLWVKIKNLLITKSLHLSRTLREFSIRRRAKRTR
jgi:hypothetical protein